MMELIDEADRVAPDCGARGICQRTGIATLDKHRTAIRLFQQSCEMQQRRLTGSRRRDQSDDFAGVQRKVSATQDGEFAGLGTIGPAYITQDKRITHAAALPPGRCAPRASLDTASPTATAPGQARPRAPRRPSQSYWAVRSA